VIPISRTRIIHSFFRPKTAAVNKFRLLSFGKFRSTEFLCRGATNENSPPFQRRESNPKNASPNGTKENMFNFCARFLPPLRGEWRLDKAFSI
jgi:hypothetical protein